MSAEQPQTGPPDRRVCDYEGSAYRQEFWERADRGFEDEAERLALRALCPPSGRLMVEIGAGFGRLAGEYHGYDRVILVDYAQSMLAEAQSRLGSGYTYVCADLYRLPLATAAADTIVQVRVLHHVEDVASAFAEVARVLRAGGSFVLEHANKRHVKAIARFLAGRQAASPFDPTPWEFVPLNWNFHPAYIERALIASGLHVRQRRAVSHFRLPVLKRLLPVALLARLDAAIGGPASGLALAPSQFVRAARLTGRSPAAGLWRCPACGSEPLPEAGDGVLCHDCGRLWPRRHGIYVFR